ncbi:MAG: 50S ribosomal protein L25 [Anaerococcus sp.]|jgi:large subunit ribosomal protein L25|nr:50S ribosomal protein L25 [Peptoniphilaceae bacterium]MDY3055301.1 50S ribosomal protein L25 [Anaerococcus sp.]
MADLNLQAQKREAVGKNKVNKLRQQSIVPGVVYAKDEDNINVQVVAKDFERILSRAGTSTIINLEMDGEDIQVLIKSYQTHPFKSEFLHVDFQKIKADEAIRVNIPVVLQGRDEIQVQPSVLIQNIDNVDVECLPKYIPQTADINVVDMQIGDTFTVADLDIAKNENITILAEEDEVVCSLQEPQEENLDEVDEAADVDAGEVPTVDETEETEDEE